MLQHLIALIKNEVFDVLQAEGLLEDECADTPGSSNNNMRAVLFQDLLILLDGHATKEHRHLDSGHVLGETLILFANLEGQLSSVAHNKDRDLEQNKDIDDFRFAMVFSWVNKQILRKYAFYLTNISPDHPLVQSAAG